MNHVWVAFIGGALAFAHCLGMCGGFALHLSQGAGRRTVLGRQLLWHAGRIFTYVFLGALAGFAGGLVQGMQRQPWIQNGFAYGTGALMIAMGLAVMGLLPKRRKDGEDAPGGLMEGVFRHFFREPSAGSAVTLGLATGFLPCPIVLGFLALAAGTQSVLSGMIIMAAMGIGTIGSLLLLGLTGQMITLRLRRWAPAVAGSLLVLLGSATILRGTEAFHVMLGCPAGASMAAETQPADNAGTPGAAPSCCEQEREK